MGPFRVMKETVILKIANAEDLPALYRLYALCGKQDDGYFETCLERGCEIIVACRGGQDVGLCVYNPEPRYALFKKLGIPEIQDLNVVPDARRQGIGATIIHHCEDKARRAGKSMIGIGVGLTSNFGPAQILYYKLGYSPDGFGVTYDREPVQAMRSYPLDEQLSLMLVKDLKDFKDS